MTGKLWDTSSLDKCAKIKLSMIKIGKYREESMYDRMYFCSHMILLKIFQGLLFKERIILLLNNAY